MVTAVGGPTVDTADALTQAIDSHSPGDTVTVKFCRDGNEHTVQVKLASRPS